MSPHQPRWIRYDTTPRPDAQLWLRAMQFAGQDLWEQGIHLVPANLLAILLAPILVFTPPVLSSLWWVAMQAAQEEVVTFRDMFDYAKTHILPAWLLTTINASVYGIILLNLIFYGASATPLPFEAPTWVYTLLVTFWILAGLLWTVTWLFAAGLMAWESADVTVSLVGALRLMRRHPIYVMLTALLIVVLLILNYFLRALWLVFTFAILALISVRSVQVLVYGMPVSTPTKEPDRYRFNLDRKGEKESEKHGERPDTAEAPPKASSEVPDA
ncbi:MAG: hypothetical protein GVY30_05840 [Chloroflexi bacterium]|jgi:hypothetical protein|nr:hypothetical protein [Chloroflexota bacterium]